MAEGTKVTLAAPTGGSWKARLTTRRRAVVPVAQGGSWRSSTNTAASGGDQRWTKDAFITGYEVCPATAMIVHHVVAFLVDPEQADRAAARPTPR